MERDKFLGFAESPEQLSGKSKLFKNYDYYDKRYMETSWIDIILFISVVIIIVSSMIGEIWG